MASLKTATRTGAASGPRLELEVEPALLGAAIEKAQRLGTDPAAELVADGVLGEVDYCRAVARSLGVPLLQRVDPLALVVTERDGATLLAQGAHLPLVRYLCVDGISRFLVSPSAVSVGKVAALLSERPALRARFAVVPRSELRRALVERCGPHMIGSARSHLFEALPHYSARMVTSGRQCFMLGLLAIAAAISFAAFPLEGLLALHAFATLAFLACVALRCIAALSAAPQTPDRLSPVDPRELPVYTVLVALHRESEIVPELLAALAQLWWPHSKLEIKLVCEADDAQTIAAIRAHRLPSFMEVIMVPSGTPRTKPRALDFAVQACSGEFVVLFDAEDVPHRYQLLEAWQRFRGAGPDLACLQAPLQITNVGNSWIAAMFGFEYGALFRGLLPFLSRHRLVIPLGGTSNHFRREALERIGGWDPFNVTEDADLGLRLSRFGYRAETIARPTYETAPETAAEWRPQRTRWFKGWMQTWLVHMRHPVRLARELGWASFIVAQILFAGMIVSALLHPLMLVTLVILALDLARGYEFGIVSTTLMAVDLTNIVLGYAGFLVLGYKAGGPYARENIWRLVLLTPFYWLMMSGAAWRALFQLFRDPFLWEKTPHPSGRAAPGLVAGLSRGSVSTVSAPAPDSST